MPSIRKRSFGRRKAQRPPATHCENCGAPLHGHWCAQCGQPAVDYRRSFRHVIVDLLNEFLNWDSKFFKTIALLFVRPWKLTSDFLAGHRVRYVHPLRLYLLASILFFFAVNHWAKSIHLQPGNLSRKDRAELQAELKQNENIPPEARTKIEQALKPNPVPTPAAQPEATSSQPSEEGGASAKVESTRFEKWLETRAKEKIGEHGTNLGFFLAALFQNLPYMMLCCIPLFAVVLKILYVRRTIFYIDHLIYALHIHSFAYLATIMIILVSSGFSHAAAGAFTGWIIALLWITFAAQIFASIRHVYRQGWFISVFKFFFGGFVYVIVLAVALAATFFITLALPG